jgi:minor extracellular serine protease Vpr
MQYSRLTLMLVVGLTLAACNQAAPQQVAIIDNQPAVQANLSSSVAGFQHLIPLNPLPAVSDQMVDGTPKSWFVELSGVPESDGGARSSLDTERAGFKRDANEKGVKYEVRRSFSDLFNGFSVRAKGSEIVKISRLPGVRAVFPIGLSALPRTEAVLNPELATAITMTGADIAQNELGLDGRGVKVGVIDSGIDLEHPDLAGRIVSQFDFVGDAYNADPRSPAFNPVPTPDPIADDCEGHGTHVAGIIGAKGQVTGVAPAVSFGAYRVFGCNGSTDDDVLLAALERAKADGMQVINMSLGSPFDWAQSPLARASSRLVKKGIVVVASAGNDGASGLYSTGGPSAGEDVISVASFDNIAVNLPVFTVSPNQTHIGYIEASGAPLPPTSGTTSIARTGTITTPNDACNPLAAGSLSGKTALIRRGGCTFYAKSKNAQAAGATAVILYNNAAGRISPTVFPPSAADPEITIPVIAITREDGIAINALLNAAPVDQTWTNGRDGFPVPTGNLISSFSSYGLVPDLTMKPDIGAPGGLIRSTYPLELGRYATLSGTSMSSPHVAGAVALLLQARPGLKAKDVRGILQNTATPRAWFGNPALGFLDSVHHQGAGMLRIDDAAQSSATVTPAKLSLGESAAGPVRTELEIRNDGSRSVTYTLSHEPGLSTGPNTFLPEFDTGFADVSFSSPTVRVGRRDNASIRLTITANPELPDHSIYGGYIVLTPQNNAGKVLRVPYVGFKGDYQSIQVLTPTANNLPWLAKVVGTNLVNQPTGANFTLQTGDTPRILFHLDHQPRRLRFDVYNINTPKKSYLINGNDYFIRNRTPNEFFTLEWDGTATKDAEVEENGFVTPDPKKIVTLPNGQYTIKITVTKALGKFNRPSDTETWISPTITVARP